MTAVEAARIPVLSSLASNPESLVLPGLPPGGAAAAAVEEVVHGVGEVAEGLLLDRLRPLGEPRVLRAGRCELPGLLKVAGRGLAALAPVGMLLDREVPHVPGVRAVPEHGCFLLRSGLEAISGHTNIIAKIVCQAVMSISSQPGPVDRRLPCRSRGQGFRRRFR